MKKILFLFILLFSANTLAFEASMTGSNLDGLTRNSTIAEYRADHIDSSENLLDISGANLIPYSEDFSQGSPVRCTTTSGTLDPFLELNGNEVIEDTTAASTHYTRYLNIAAVTGSTYTFSVYARPRGRDWVALVIGGEAATPSAYFNLTTRNVGTISNCEAWFCDHKNGWDRICIKFTADTTGNHHYYTYIAEADADTTFTGNGTTAIELFGRQVTENRTYLTGPGVYHPTNGLDKPLLDLTSQNEPFVYAQSDLQKGNGRRYEEVQLNGTNQYWSRGADGIWDVNDSDHTYTIYHWNDTTADYLFQHSFDGFGGIGFYTLHSGIRTRYQSPGGQLAVESTAPNSTGRYKILQEVRSGNLAKCCVNGYCSAWTDVTGYGTDDATRGVSLGSTILPGNYLDGSIIYFRLDAEALSDEELNNERMKIWGAGSGQYVFFPESTFTRSTEAYKELTNTWSPSVSAPALVYSPINVPRIGGEGGGILIESQVVHSGRYTEDITGWTTNGGVKTANTHYAPNGTLTADTFDTTAGLSTHFIAMYTADLGSSLAGRTFNASIWLRADTPHIVTTYLVEDGVGVVTNQDNYVTSNWRRFEVEGTMTGGDPGNSMYLRVYAGDAGVATGIVQIWGANVTEGKFVPTYYPILGAPENVITAADSLTFDPHPEDSRDLLPYTFGPNLASDKLTIYFEAKCEWEDNNDIGETRYLIGISGDSGVASDTRNNVSTYVNGAGNLYFLLEDDSDTTHYVFSAANPVDFSAWFSVRGIIDFSDLSNLDLYIGQINTSDETTGGNTYSGNSGTAELDTTNSLIRIGQDHDGDVNAHCRFRNLKIEPQIILP